MLHYKEKLSAYLNGELSKEERQRIAEHLLLCESCRQEHDHLRFGIKLAGKLYAKDAPPSVWQAIERDLNAEKVSSNNWFSGVFVFNAKVLVSVGIILATTFLGLTFYLKSSVPSVEIVQNVESWKVETLSGETGKKSLAVGDFLETNDSSRAKITVADIGKVEVAPNSRVKLVKTSEEEHRLSLEQGSLHARINAPPRLFIVDTPSAVAVDLGCEYTLEVDPQGNSKLHVTGGYVALERDGFESFVPAGAMCLTSKDGGLGTPFFADVSEEFQRNLKEIDFGKDGNIEQIIAQARRKDSLTLWHLLGKADEKNREKIFRKLVSLVKLPSGLTQTDVLRLDKEALSLWKKEVKLLWVE